MGTRTAAIALALLVLLPVVRAQAAPLAIELTPGSVATHVGNQTTASVRVTTDGLSPMIVRLYAEDATGGFTIVFQPAEFEVLPGRATTSVATVRGLEVGTESVLVVAQERTALGANGTTRATAVLGVTVRAAPANGTGNGTGEATSPPPADPPPPDLPSPRPSSPTNGTGAPSNSTSPGRSNSTPTNGTGSTLPPANTSGSNDPSPEPGAADEPAANATRSNEPQAPPGPAEDDASASAALRVQPDSLTLSARQGERAPFVLLVENPSGRSQEPDVLLRLPLGWGGSLASTRVVVPARGSVEIRGDVTPGAGAEDDFGSVVVGTQVVRLSLRIAPAPEPLRASADDVAPAGAGDPALPEDPAPREVDPPAAPTLRLVPAEVGAPPGSSVVLTLFVTNPSREPLRFRAAAFAQPLATGSAASEVEVPAQGTHTVTFTIAIPEDIVVGSEYVGRVETTIAGAPEPSFVVRVSSAEVVLHEQDLAPGGDARVAMALVAATLGAGALAIAALWRRWPALGLLPLYARLAPRRALEHPRRAKMLALVQEHPGLTFADVQRTLGLTNGVARHHLALLEAAGVVRSVVDGPFRRLWPAGSAVEATPPLRDRALEQIAKRGVVKASDLASALGVSRQALHYHVKRLVDDGAIAADRIGSETVLRAR